MTKDEFEQRCCELCSMTIEEYRVWFDTTTCSCGNEKCYGWTLISKLGITGQAHMIA